MEKQGLSQKKVESLLKKHGENKLKQKKMISWLKVLWAQFKSPLIYILVAASGISLALGDYTDAGVIGVALVLNTILGFYQEMKAERSLEALSKLLTPKAKVIRDGKRQLIEASKVVPGDICVLEIGERVPADGKVIKSDSLSVNEAMLTGESAPVEKGAQEVRNLVYMGTMVSGGMGMMRVEKTGQETEIGKIADKLTSTSEEKTPLQKQIARFSKQLAIIVGVISVIILTVGLVAGDPFVEIFTTAVAVAVSAIPEGLAVSLTVILAIGMQRIFKHKALVRKLVAAETLGSVTVICADKTGTLTEGKMRVVDALHSKKEDSELTPGVRNQISLQMAAVLCNNMRDPLEIRMMDWAMQGVRNLEVLEKEFPRLDEIPFDPKWRYIATLHKTAEKNLLLVSGAPEEILSRCKITDERRKKWEKQFVSEGKKGRRLVGFGYKQYYSDTVSHKDIKDLKWIGSLVYEDPVRKGVDQALNKTQKAGIKVKVITGDYRFTAEAVVNAIKLTPEKLKANQIMEGWQLEKISEEELSKKIDEVLLFARIKPEQKLRIVQVLQNKGEVVAVTGDGVNDAPAVKKADIGIVVEKASAVAKEIADMVLLDSNFETIVMAIEEGRGMFVNLKKIILYLLSDAFAEVILVLGSMFLGLLLPITAAQILWINLVDDGLPDFALALEPKPSNLMQKKPKGYERKLLDGEVKLLIGLVSGVSGILALGLFYVYYKMTGDLILARTMSFTALAVSTLMYMFSCKTLEKPLFRENIFDNWWLIGAVGAGFSLQLMAIYLPGLQKMLGTEPLGVNEWLMVGMVSGLVIMVIEGTKFVYNKKL